MCVRGFSAVLFSEACPQVCLLQDRSRMHAEFDNNDDCNKCHESFEGVPRTKCLDCHQKIARRIYDRKGYHGRVATEGACHQCHTEHRGRDFDITNLKRHSFDHRQTGWPLTGSHRGVPCRECHSAKRPGSQRDSYLDTPNTCQSCHGQAAKTNLDQCEDCHNTQSWAELNRNFNLITIVRLSFRCPDFTRISPAAAVMWANASLAPSSLRV